MADEKKHTYQSTTLGVPALKMVLVHARNDAQNADARKGAEAAEALLIEDEGTPLPTEQAVRKIIRRLEEPD